MGRRAAVPVTLPGRLRRAALDVTPLRTAAYRRLLIGDAVSVVGTQITAVAVPIQVYEQTRSAAAVGFVGLAGLLPLIVFGLYGGAIADAVDRRRLVLMTTVGQAALSTVLLLQALAGLHSTALLYVVIAVQAALFSMDSPARSAFTPRLLPKELLPAANALRQVEFNLGVTIGPLLAGALVAGPGYSWAYGLDALTFTASIWAVASLPPMPPHGGGRRAGTASVLEGLAFLRTRPVLLMTFVVDLIAMVFAMPRALFPSIAHDVYGGGAQTAGALYSALAAGALLGALFSGWFGRVHRQGVAVLAAIVAWGVSIALFGATSSLAFGLLMLACAGASDMVSAVFRNAILQTAAPDEMRGRLGGVFIVVVAGGPRLGDGRAGLGAELVGVQGAVVAGGLAVIGLTAACAAAVPRFRQYDVREPYA
ncbi:MAG: major facilitator superfamily 1 [Frankiales bacterium]|jgi:MFS family permease|nr:major facilitator superfamily 1 [Frankiales bacterium]